MYCRPAILLIPYAADQCANHLIFDIDIAITNSNEYVTNCLS